MSKIGSARECFEVVEREAAEKAVQTVRSFDLVEVGGVPTLKNKSDGKLAQVVRQGDVYIHVVPSGWKKGAALRDNQLAIGNTQGSRHVAEAPAKCYAGVKLPGYMNSTAFMGPVIESEGRFTVSHPEHAHCDLPAGTYQVTHQLDADTMMRVQD